MKACDFIWGTTRIAFKHLVGKKHVIYCIVMTFFLTDLNANTLLIASNQFFCLL